MALCEQIVRNRLLVNIFYHEESLSYEVSLVDIITSHVIGNCLYRIDIDYIAINPNVGLHGFRSYQVHGITTYMINQNIINRDMNMDKYYPYPLRRMLSAIKKKISMLKKVITQLKNLRVGNDGDVNSDAGDADSGCGDADSGDDTVGRIDKIDDADSDAGDADSDAGDADSDAGGDADSDDEDVAGDANSDAGDANSDAGDANSDAGDANSDGADAYIRRPRKLSKTIADAENVITVYQAIYELCKQLLE